MKADADIVRLSVPFVAGVGLAAWIDAPLVSATAALAAVAACFFFAARSGGRTAAIALLFLGLGVLCHSGSAILPFRNPAPSAASAALEKLSALIDSLPFSERETNALLKDFLTGQSIAQDEPTVETAETEPDAEPAPAFESSEDSIELSVPCNDLTAQQLINLIRILYSRQKLLSAMLKNDGIRIDEELIGLLNDEKPDTADRILELTQNEVRVGMVTGVNIANETFTLTLVGTNHNDDLPTYVRLMGELMNRAKAAGFVSAKLIDPAEGEMKYYVNSFLNQLGFGDAEHKNDRAILMGHIMGYAAFKNSAQMEKHKARLKDRRQAARQSTPADPEAGDTE